MPKISDKMRQLKDERARHIRDRVDKSTDATEEVRKLSQELFISEQTIWKDLKRSSSKRY